jgi:cytochrome c oxidase cbb3-type subunit 1
MFLQYGAIISTIAVEFVVATVIINFVGTAWGSHETVIRNLPLRWFFTGGLFYFVTCLQCAFQTTLTFQQLIHFTDWVVSHAHLVMFGVFGFWIFGIVGELWPRLVGRPWHSTRLNTWHYWLTTVGTALMVVDLTAAGLIQGYLWRDLAPWEASLRSSTPFWILRSVTGFLILFGTICFFVNLWLTARPRRAPAAAAAPAGASARA